MLLFESFNKYYNLKKRISDNEHYFIVVDTHEDAYKLMDFFDNVLEFRCTEDYTKDKIINHTFPTQQDQLICFEPKGKIYGFRSFTKDVIEDSDYQEYFYSYNNDMNLIKKAYDVLYAPTYQPRQFIRESYGFSNDIKVEEFINMRNDEIYNIVEFLAGEYGFDDYQLQNSVYSVFELKKYLTENKNTLTLYRLLNADSKDKINQKYLGKHFTTEKTYLDDEITLYDIGIDTDKPMFIVTVTVPTENINLKETINARVDYPFENEITLKTLKDIKIQSIDEFNINETVLVESKSKTPPSYIIANDKENALEINNFILNFLKIEYVSDDNDSITTINLNDFSDSKTLLLFIVFKSSANHNIQYVCASVNKNTIYGDGYEERKHRICSYPEDKSKLIKYYAKTPTYKTKQMVYESFSDKINKYRNKLKNGEEIYIKSNSPKSSYDIMELLLNENLNYVSYMSRSDIVNFNYDNDYEFMLFVIRQEYNKNEFFCVEFKYKDLKKESEILEAPGDFPLLKALYRNPTYKSKQLVYESVNGENLIVWCDNRDECVGFEQFLHDNGWSYLGGSRYLILSNPRYDQLSFNDFDDRNKTFSATQTKLYNIIKYGQEKSKIESYFKKLPTYEPRKFIRESKENKVLHAFDMDDTLVYSKRFEEHVKPMLIREYLTPEIIMNNKLDDIGVGIEQLKYEDGRIYFDDPQEDYKIPQGSSWVRKKGRVYIIQPDAYFMTDESMPIGTYDDIVELYNNSEYKCIITARNEKIRSQTIKALKNLGVEKPNVGLFMYPINSFSYTYEYKSNKLIELYKTQQFTEIHYYDDNIKLLKKIKENLKDKDINIKFYKVTKNRYRQL